MALPEPERAPARRGVPRRVVVGLGLAVGCLLAVLFVRNDRQQSSPVDAVVESTAVPTAVVEQEDVVPAPPTEAAPPADESSDSPPLDPVGYLWFDGVDDFIELPGLDVSGSALTVEAWIASDDLANCGSSDCRIVSKATGVAEQQHHWMLSTVEVDGTTRLRFRLRTGEKTETLIASTGDLTENMWHHVAATYDGQTMRLFLAGDEVGTKPHTGVVMPAPEVATWIGSNPPAAVSRPWSGAIDEVRIWNVARSAQQLGESIIDSDAPEVEGLVAWYDIAATDVDLVGADFIDLTGGHVVTMGSGAGSDPSDPVLVGGPRQDPVERPAATSADQTSADEGGVETELADDSQLGGEPAPRAVTQDVEPTGVCGYTTPDAPNDDPNELFDGQQGRYIVSPNQIPAGYPTPATTGICGVGLTPSDLEPSDGLLIEEDGTIVDRVDIQGAVRIEANDVTIRNSQITSGDLFPVLLVPGFNGLVIEDTRIRAVGPEPANAITLRGSATIRRVHVSGGADGFKTNSGDLLIEDSFYAGNYRINGSAGSGSGTHNDVMQVRNGSNYTIRNNSFLGPYQQSTSVLIFQSASGAGGGPISDVLIEGNYFSGGGYTMYTQQKDEPMTNVVVRNNRIEAESWQFGWRRDSTGAADYSGNTQIPS